MSLSVRGRRRIVRIVIWVCLLSIVFAAVAITVAPHRFGAGLLLRIDIPAVAGIAASRYYLRSTGCASPVRQCPGGCRNHRHEDGQS